MYFSYHQLGLKRILKPDQTPPRHATKPSIRPMVGLIVGELRT